MSGNSKIIIFVITISLSGYFANSTDPVLPGNNTEHCSDKSLDYRNAGTNFYETFKKMFKATVENKETYNETVTVLTEMSKKYLLAAKMHCKSSLNDTLNHDIFIKLLAFTLKNTTLIKDLVENKRFDCINELKPKLQACRHNGTESSLWGKLMSRTVLTFNEVSCPRTLENKICVIDVLKEKCDPMLYNYVESLFDFMHSNYCKVQNTAATADSGSGSGSGNVRACLATLSVIFLEALMV